MTDRTRQSRRAAARTLPRRKRSPSIFWLAMVVVVVGGVALIAVARGNRPGVDFDGPDGTAKVEVASSRHVEGPVAYDTLPPAGGDHWSVWQNCGFYPSPIVTEQGVHSLEHGAVWITYQPDLDDDQVDHLKRLAQRQNYLLVSPWPDELPAPVVASAWARQIELDSATDPRLDEFIRAFRTGPTTPEPGAACTGGAGQPE